MSLGLDLELVQGRTIFAVSRFADNVFPYVDSPEQSSFVD